MKYNSTTIRAEDDIAPASGSRTASLVAFSFKALAVAFGALLLIYLILVSWLHSHLAGQAISISQAAGAPMAVEKFLGGFLFWLLAAALLPLAARLLIASFNPFRTSGTVIGGIASLIGIGLAMSLLPTGLRTIRGVDTKGLPIEMERSDPGAARWWNPDGEPVLFFSLEEDGSMGFWNRPGTTPQSGAESKPVTREIRAHWKEELKRETTLLRQQEEEKRLETVRRRDEAAQEAKALALKQERSMAKREEELEREIRRERTLAEAATTAAKAAAELQKAKELEHRRELEIIRAENLRQRQASAQSRSAAEKNTGGTNLSRHGANVISAIPVTGSDWKPVGRQPSGWITVRLEPWKYIQPWGVTNSRIEIRSNGHGLFQAPGFARIAFRGGHSTFHTPAKDFRMYCNQDTSFLVTYRWIPQ